MKKNTLMPLYLIVLVIHVCSANQSNLSAVSFEKELLSKGLIDIQEVDSTIKVDLKYAGIDNFMKSNVYGEFKKGYLQRDAALKLVEANRLLKKIRPDLSLLVLDALRPRHVQKKMWSLVQGTPMQRYVANPRYGSMHNYGCAVDITIVDQNGVRLDMGTPVDHFGKLSEIRLENIFLKQGKLTEKQVENRRLLRQVMVSAGFNPIPIEWWHFEAFEKGFIRKTYSIIE
ncbi:MAG: M15 family metallopeptidase [Chitinispirillaceae bacterium]|nr:M15 family metallopeptidase [Chitinispirillaceae bacterium]